MPLKRRRIAGRDDWTYNWFLCTVQGVKYLQSRWRDRALLLGSPAQATAWAGDPDQPGGALPSGDCSKLLYNMFHNPQYLHSRFNIPPGLHYIFHNPLNSTINVTCPPVPRRLRPSCAVPLGSAHLHSSQGLPSQPSVQDLQGAQENGVVTLAGIECFWIVPPDFCTQMKNELQPTRAGLSKKNVV